MLKTKNKLTKRNKKRKRKFFLLFFLFFCFSIGIIVFLKYFLFQKEKVRIEGGVFDKNTPKIELEKNLQKMVKDYPIEKMVPFIIEKDNQIAAFLVSIAKKESDWGKYAPLKNGKDCYNYWGFRDPENTEGTGGFSCFSSPQEAVNTVSKRIEFLVKEQKLDTPAKMIIWKCGFNCKNHSIESVKKWISDVNYYFKKILYFENFSER